MNSQILLLMAAVISYGGSGSITHIDKLDYSARAEPVPVVVVHEPAATD